VAATEHEQPPAGEHLRPVAGDVPGPRPVPDYPAFALVGWGRGVGRLEGPQSLGDEVEKVEVGPSGEEVGFVAEDVHWPVDPDAGCFDGLWVGLEGAPAVEFREVEDPEVTVAWPKSGSAPPTYVEAAYGKGW